MVELYRENFQPFFPSQSFIKDDSEVNILLNHPYLEKGMTYCLFVLHEIQCLKTGMKSSAKIINVRPLPDSYMDLFLI